MTWGLIIVVLGVMLLLDNLNVLDFGDTLHNYWPLFLVIIGLRMILFPKQARERPAPPAPVENLSQGPSQGPSNRSTDTRFNESRFIGDTLLRVSSDDFLGGQTSCFIGDEDIDISEVKVKSGERVVNISGFIGDTKVLAPKNVPFMVTANCMFGDIRIFENKYDGIGQSRTYKSPGYDAASARLRIQISKFIGDVTVW